MTDVAKPYPTRLGIDYPERLSRWKTLFRLILIIPILLWVSSFSWHETVFRSGVVGHTAHSTAVHSSDSRIQESTAMHATDSNTQQSAAHAGSSTNKKEADKHTSFVGIWMIGTFMICPVFWMLLFRRKYPRWIFDWNHSMFSLLLRVFAYFALLTDQFPDSEKEQSVHLHIDPPEHGTLCRFMPLVKWILLFPHYFCLAALLFVSYILIVLAWVSIIFSARYPRVFFDFIVGTQRWYVRVISYGFLLTTDRYPPFSME